MPIITNLNKHAMAYFQILACLIHFLYYFHELGSGEGCMSKQDIDIIRSEEQNTILNLEKKYMDKIESIVLSNDFISDLKNIELEVQTKYQDLQFIWGKKNKIKEASERLLRHHMYTSFPDARKFYPSPISCDIALVLDDVILNIDVKTIDRNGNARELRTTQLEHNQTSFINNPVGITQNFPGYSVRSNIEAIDHSGKPVLTYLLKIGYNDNGEGNFNFLNTSNLRYPSIVLTCIPNGKLSELFANDLCTGFKDYIYYGNDHSEEEYYKPKIICGTKTFNGLNTNSKFLKIKNTVTIPDFWKHVIWESNKIGFYDETRQQIWQTQNKNSKGKVYLCAVKFGNTMRFNDEWLEQRYDSQNNYWSGVRKYYNIYN